MVLFLQMWFQDFAVYGWIAAMGVAVSVACALLGCFLVVRKTSMIGDAISHAVLPGLVLAFLFSGSRAAIPMVIGAVVFGMLASYLIEFIRSKSPVKEDAAIGIVFTTLFAVGVILVSLFADKIDLDQECVLYGEITFVPLEPHLFIGSLDLGPQPFVVMALVCLTVVATVVLFYKEFLVTSFDAPLALSLGIPVAFVHYVLMGLLATTIVSAFESVGAILVVAMLIAPGATAYLLTDRLPVMLWLSVVHAVVSTLMGLHIAVWLDASVAGSIAVTGLGLFLLAFVFSPSHGVVSKALRHLHLVRRIRMENRLIEACRQGALLTEEQKGRVQALLKARHDWEAFLSQEIHLPPDHLEEPADRMEHYLTPEMIQGLEGEKK